MVKISVVIPVYNVERYIRQCLDSIINQTFQDFEIICVDDGSTDNSVRIIEEYSNFRIKLVKQEHRGAAEARNNGMKLAQGKYIQFLDSDDYFEPTMLEDLYKKAEEFSTDITVCSAVIVDENNNILENGNRHSPINLDVCPLDKPFSPQDFPDDLFILFSAAPWNKLYLKDMIINNNLKFQNLSSCNDSGFVRIANCCAKKIVVINKVLVNYRFNRKGSTAEFRANKAGNLLKAGNYLKDFLVKNNLFEFYKNAYIKAMKNTIRWEVSLCNTQQYKAFLKELKVSMSEDWKIFIPVLKKGYVTPEYIKEFIGNKKVVLWGASLFLKDVLSKETAPNTNILGIIDKNPEKQGTRFGNYTIYSPNKISELKPDAVLFMVNSNYEENYPKFKTELEKTFSDIEVLPNIFERKEAIPIVLAADKNYAAQMYITTLSTIKNKNEDSIYHFIYLVPDEFPEDYKNEFYKLQNNSVEIEFINMKSAFESQTMQIGHITTPTYYRLNIPELLGHYAKIIYLDVDVIVMKDLSEFYETDIHNEYIAGVKAAAYIQNENNREYYKSIGLKDVSSYINAGVTLWNLSKIIKDNLQTKLLELADKNFSSMDQDVINVVFQEKIKHLELKYNLMTKYKNGLESGKLDCIYGKENIKEAVENPTIIHYADSIKPWSTDDVWLKSIWENYAKDCPIKYKTQIGLTDRLLNQCENKSVVFWGASNFLKERLSTGKFKDKKILGIIDKNASGKEIMGYTVYYPEELSTLKPERVIFSIQNNHDKIYHQVKAYLSKNYPDIELMPDVFKPF